MRKSTDLGEKMMKQKKWLLCAMALGMILLMAACGNQNQKTSVDEQQYTDWEGWESHEVLSKIPVYVYEGEREEPTAEEGVTTVTVHHASETDCDAYLNLLKENGWQEAGGDVGAHNHILQKDGMEVAFGYIAADGSIVINVKDIA